MKTLNIFKYFFLVVLGATLMFSCSEDDSTEDLLSQNGNIETRNNDEWSEGYDDGTADCFVKLCVDITPSNNSQFTDITTITLGNDVWTISNGIVTLPNGSTTNVINNQYCFTIPVTQVANVLVEFHGYGGIAVSGAWNNGADVCDLYEVAWPGTFKAPINAAEELAITCDPPCAPNCIVEACVTFIEGSPTDNYTLLLPNGGSVTIANGQVVVNTPNNQDQFPLPPDGTFCLPLPIFDPVTVQVIYNGTGSVSINATWPGGEECEIFAAGQCTGDEVHVNEPVTLSCEPSCPQPECEIEACITFIPGDVTDNYTLLLPTVGSVTIANGVVTLPSGCQFPLPDDGTFCTTLPIFAPVTATVIYNGTGSVEIDATYEDGTVCTIFSAGVNSELELHIIEEVTLSCDPVCPPIPDCYVKVCLDFIDAGNDLFRVTIPNVGIVQFNGGQILLPDGSTIPNPGGTFCIDLPVFNGGSTAELFFFGQGSAVVNVTYPDLLVCEVFSAGLGTSQTVSHKEDVTLTCEGPCAPEPEFCMIEICANFTALTSADIYQVTFASGDQLTIQNGWVTLPGGAQIPYNGTQFCAMIEIEVGTTETANLFFSGKGSIVTTIEYQDGGFCPIFKAKNTTAEKDVTLGCTPIC